MLNIGRALPRLRSRWCVQCEREYLPTGRNQQRCAECRARTCERCGNRFIPKNSSREERQRYCSRSCGNPRLAAACHPDRPAYGNGQCAPCYRKAHHDRRSKEARKRTLAGYGITPEEYGAHLKTQRGRCAICRLPERRRLRGLLTRLVVDHDHVTGKVRGLLCHGCNVSIGHFRESPELVTKVLRYLRIHRQMEIVGGR